MQDDIVAKLLDFIAEPRAKDDSTLSDDQVKSVAYNGYALSEIYLWITTTMNRKFASVFLPLLISMFYTSVLCRDQILGSANERWAVQLRIQKAHTRDLGR